MITLKPLCSGAKCKFYRLVACGVFIKSSYNVGPNVGFVTLAMAGILVGLLLTLHLHLVTLFSNDTQPTHYSFRFTGSNAGFLRALLSADTDCLLTTPNLCEA